MTMTKSVGKARARKENSYKFFWKKLGEEAASQKMYISEEEREEIEECVFMQSNNTEIVTTGLTVWNARGRARARGESTNNKSKKKAEAVKKNVKTCHLLRITGERPSDFIFGQESHLGPDDKNALEGIYKHSGAKIYYSNRNSRSAGVFTIIPAHIVQDYCTEVVEVGSEWEGYTLVVRCLPKVTVPKGKSILLINFYGVPGDNETKRKQQLEAILQVPKEDYVYFGGDMNFVETQNETGPYPRTEEFWKVWQRFNKDFGLREAYQPLPTRYQLNREVKGSTASRLDRIYLSHSEADLTITYPWAYVVTSQTNVFDAYRANLVNPDDEEQKERNIHRIKITSDHLPVRVVFRDAQKVRSRLPRIRPEEVDDEFVKKFEQEWVNKIESLKECDPYHVLDVFIQTAYDILWEKKVNFNEKVNKDKSDLHKLGL